MLWIPVLLILAVLATSTLSGIIGMAGGLILMALLVLMLSVPAAMIVHGAVQGTANGSRAWFLREHIQWRILPPYLIGTGAALTLFMTLSIVADPAVILIVIGLFPWLARLLPRVHGLSIEYAPTAAGCGLLVTAAQLFAGASGPLLDMFYLHTHLNRYQIIATKALTQTVGHAVKLVYYSLVVTATDPVAPWLLAVAVLSAVAGTRLGTFILGFVSESRFRTASQMAVLTIATYCLAQGVYNLST